MEQISKKVVFHTATEKEDDQRVDNFLITYLKGVPKTRIYKMIRKGEVRVNKGRVKPDTRIFVGDIVRIPPVTMLEKEVGAVPGGQVIQMLEDAILFENEQVLIVNKPAGIAVHGGSGLDYGVVEAFRASRGEHDFLELVHRLDRDTSGCLMIAKKRSALKWLHACLREDSVDKRYHALVVGSWPKHVKVVEAPLKKNVLKSGERMVRVAQDGKPSRTDYRVIQAGGSFTLVEAKPVTGRTHQIRVHCQYLGHPIVGDKKYWSSELQEPDLGSLRMRLMLHARTLTVALAPGEKVRTFEAPYSDQFSGILERVF